MRVCFFKNFLSLGCFWYLAKEAKNYFPPCLMENFPAFQKQYIAKLVDSKLCMAFGNRGGAVEDAGNFHDAIAMGLALEWERAETRLMKESLRDDVVALLEMNLERSKLMEEKQRMLAEIEIQKKVIDDFIIFIGAVENNDVEIAQNFDEKAMMDAIVPMLKSDGNSGRNVEAFGRVHGENNDPEATIEGTERDGSEGSNAGEEGGSSNGDRRN